MFSPEGAVTLILPKGGERGQGGTRARRATRPGKRGGRPGKAVQLASVPGLEDGWAADHVTKVNLLKLDF